MTNSTRAMRPYFGLGILVAAAVGSACGGGAQVPEEPRSLGRPATANAAPASPPAFVATDDLNSDGYADLVTAHEDNTVHVWLGKGDGTPGVESVFPTGDGPTAVVIADLDGDGALDVATSDARGNTVSVLLGNGDGTLRAAVKFAVGNSPLWVAAADINEDGNLDLLTACNDGEIGSVSVLLGVGDGTFTTGVSVRTSYIPRWVTLGDVDGDGHVDMVSTPYIGRLGVFLGNGDGTFGTESVPRGGLCARGGILGPTHIVDVNGDGKLDVVTARKPEPSRSSPYPVVFLNPGSGEFNECVSPGGWFGRVGAVADVNGDGFPDLLVRYRQIRPSTDQVRVFLNDGKGVFSALGVPYDVSPVAHSLGFGLSITLADLHATGSLDLVSAGSRLTVWGGAGDGTFADRVDY